MTEQSHSNAPAVSPESRTESPARRLPKDFIPGYASVLLRRDVKEGLYEWMHKQGFPRESQPERCLVSAALEMVLNDLALHERWAQAFQRAAVRDIQVIRRPTVRPSQRIPGGIFAGFRRCNQAKEK
jgi:hypothetical protein